MWDRCKGTVPRLAQGSVVRRAGAGNGFAWCLGELRLVAISEPDSLALYLREFDRLHSVAVSGDEARALLDRVAQDMRRSDA